MEWIHHISQQLSSIGYINSLWETQLQAIAFFININNFLFATFIWAVIYKHEGPSWSLYLVFLFYHIYF